jgi:hypothetical protein
MKTTIWLTFDNLGEAAELELGIWPHSSVLGSHPSIARGLPSVLGVLGDTPATFFVEGWSAQMYPDAVQEVCNKGHEIGVHGWRHENWSDVGSKEYDLLRKSIDSFGRLGISPVAFRPPGGVPTANTDTYLRELKIPVCSPVGQTSGILNGIYYIPYQWMRVDAFAFEPLLGKLRKALLGDEEELDPDVFLDSLIHSCDSSAQESEICVLVFHSYLMAEPRCLDVLAQILSYLKNDDRFEIVSCQRIIESDVYHSKWFAGPPAIGSTGWGSD